MQVCAFEAEVTLWPTVSRPVSQSSNLDTWTVVHMTAAKFKSLIFSVSGFALSRSVGIKNQNSSDGRETNLRAGRLDYSHFDSRQMREISLLFTAFRSALEPTRPSFRSVVSSNYFEFRTINKVHKPSVSECYALSSEHFRIYPTPSCAWRCESGVGVRCYTSWCPSSFQFVAHLASSDLLGGPTRRWILLLIFCSFFRHLQIYVL
jgi:hypothetical protein